MKHIIVNGNFTRYHKDTFVLHVADMLHNDEFNACVFIIYFLLFLFQFCIVVQSQYEGRLNKIVLITKYLKSSIF